MHQDVVVRDVVLGVGVCPTQLELRSSRHALGEALGEPHLRPLPAAPARPGGRSLLEAREREVEQDDEGQLVLEPVVAQMSRGLVAGEHEVDRKRRPGLDIGVEPQLASCVFQVAFEPREA